MAEHSPPALRARKTDPPKAKAAIGHRVQGVAIFGQKYCSLVRPRESETLTEIGATE